MSSRELTAAPDALMGMVPSAVFPGKERVELIGAGGARLTEPFYDESLDAIRASRAPIAALSFGELRSVVGDTLPAPRAVVLHTGRCGSTLLMRMLLHDRSVMTVSEPTPIGSLHWDALHRTERSEPNLRAMADLLVILDRFAVARGQQVVLKLSSWETVDAARLVDLMPTVPVVFVHRPVEEVVASLLHEPPAWAKELDVEALAQWAPQVAKLPADAPLGQVFAAIWASAVAAVLDLGSDRVLAISYRDLVEHTDDVLTSLAGHIGLNHSWRPKGAASELRYYAKNPNPMAVFDPSGRHARPALTADMVLRVHEAVGNLPDQLATLNRAR